MDKMTREQRHRCMAAIRSKDTRPELLVRRYLFSRGFRYRLCCPRLPGHPDLVLRKYRTVIFVNGCFWHGHEGCPSFRLPKSNTGFWLRKIERNASRDVEEQRQLRSMGWHCITVWECQLLKPRREETLASLEQTLLHIYLQDRSPRYAPQPESTPMAAEPEAPYGKDTK
ncbi:MAG: very short patch repair endonuclease [Prevotellaceae bacterium]|nr:very short patch repair endonuclease [Prevotellaceae bacterium]